MKYKIGDKVRLESGDVKIIDGFGTGGAGIVSYTGMSLGSIYISDPEHANIRLVVSSITEDLLERFRSGAVIFEIRKDKDFWKLMTILEKSGITFFKEFDSIKVKPIGTKFIRYRTETSTYPTATSSFIVLGSADKYQNQGYEIIEIIDPVYLKTTKIEEDSGQLLEFYKNYKGIISELKKLIDDE